MNTYNTPAKRRFASFALGLGLAFLGATSHGQMALKGKLLFEDNFKIPAQYTKEPQAVSEGWQVRSAHADWKRTSEGVQSVWQSGHMPVLAYSGSFSNAVLEVDFRFQKDGTNWAACRLSPTNPQLNPRAYAASVWANQDGKGRAYGMVLEHDEWKPGTITTVQTKPAIFEPNKWYTLRMELIGSNVLASCNGVTVSGTHEKFGLLPKTAVYLGVGTCPHELRSFRVYAAAPNPAWSALKPRTASAGEAPVSK